MGLKTVPCLNEKVIFWPLKLFLLSLQAVKTPCPEVTEEMEVKSRVLKAETSAGAGQTSWASSNVTEPKQ